LLQTYGFKGASESRRIERSKRDRLSSLLLRLPTGDYRDSNNKMTSAPAPQELTRSMLISQDLEKIAAASPTMYIGTPDDQGVMLVPTPASVAKTGIIPEGFSIDLALDPDTVLAAYSTVRFPQETIEALKAIMNSPDNVKIVPTSIYENKREVTLEALEKIKRDPNLKHLIGGLSAQNLHETVQEICGIYN